MKSNIRKILSATESTGTGRKALLKCKLSRSMLYLISENTPENESQMIQAISNIISQESTPQPQSPVKKTQPATPIENKSNQFKTSSDVAILNVFKTIVDENQFKTSSDGAMLNVLKTIVDDNICQPANAATTGKKQQTDSRLVQTS